MWFRPMLFRECGARAALAVVGFFCIVAAAPAASFRLTSSAFGDGQRMPASAAYRGGGCDGGNVSPSLAWTGAPSRTRSFVLTVCDPDAPVPGEWWHWVRTGIGARVTRLPAGDRTTGVDGTTSFGSAAYGGPCPPPGDAPHHYRFVLQALDVESIAATSKTTGPQIAALVGGHVLATAVLIGRYGRPK